MITRNLTNIYLLDLYYEFFYQELVKRKKRKEKEILALENKHIFF